MWERIKDYGRLAFIIAGALSIALFVSVVGFVTWDRLRAPEEQRLTDENIASILQVLGTPGERLTVAPDSGEAPGGKTDDEFPEGELKWREKIEKLVRKANRQQDEISEEKDLQNELLKDLQQENKKEREELMRQREALDETRRAWAQERNAERARIARLADTVRVKINKGMEPKLVAQDWEAMYNEKDLSEADRRRVLIDIVQVFEALPTGVRTDIAEVMTRTLRLKIMEQLRQKAAVAKTLSQG